MNELFDLLENRGLVNDQQIESTIMNRWSTKHILDFRDSLLNALKIAPASREQPGLTAFDFIANSDLSGQHAGCCAAWDCRLRRIGGLARFSALYADHVYIQNYFENYEHVPTNRYEELVLRHSFAGDLKIMLWLRPLMTADIVRIVQPPEPGFHLCPSCARRLIPTFKEVNSALERHTGVLGKRYVEQTAVTLHLDPRLSHIPIYQLEARGPQELWEHGETLVVTSRLPRSLLTRVKSTSGLVPGKGLDLSKEEITKVGIVEESLRVIASDIWSQHFFSRMRKLDLKYLTNRDIDISFLRAVTKDEDFKKYNDVLKSHLLYELPILEGVPVRTLLDIRIKEKEVFLVWRDAINEVITTYISQRKALSELDAREIYTDMVQPKLHKLNARINSIKRSLWKKTTRDIAISGGILTVGLCSGILTPELRTILAAMGGFQALKELVTSIEEARGAPEEIRSDNFYFLWKASKL